MMARLLTCMLMLAMAGCDSLVTKPVRYGDVEVMASRRDGSAVAGVPLVLFTGSRPVAYATTDSGGKAHFERVAAGDQYGLFAQEPAGFAFPEHLTASQNTTTIDGFRVVTDSTTRLALTLLKVGPGTVTAHIQDERGSAAADVLVELFNGAGVRARTRTDASGNATFGDVPFGMWGIFVTRPGDFRDVGEPVLLTRDGIIVEQGIVAREQVTLQRCNGAVVVTVADPARGAAAGVPLYLYDATTIRDSARTDATGKAQFTTGCGEFGVRTPGTADWLVTPTRGSAVQDGIIVHRGTSAAVSLAVTFSSCRWALSVSVTDAAGTPVPGATVDVYDATGAVTSRVADSGQLTFADLRCTLEYGARVTSPPGWTVAPGRGSSFFDGLRGTNGQVVPVRFVLTRP